MIILISSTSKKHNNNKKHPCNYYAIIPFAHSTHSSVLRKVILDTV